MTHWRLVKHGIVRAGLAAAVAGLLAAPALAGDPPARTGEAAAPSQGAQPGLAQELRGDAGNQQKMSDIDRQIERTWAIVEEIRQNAQNLRIAHARIKDALENSDCGVAAKMLQTLKRSQEGIDRLGANLDTQCKDIDPRTQKQLAQACDSERQTLAGETAALKRQHEQVLGMCPDLRGK